jgi:hypothetical protein
MITKTFSNVITNAHLKQKIRDSMTIQYIFNRFSIEKIKSIISFIDAFKLRKKQQEEERMHEFEKKKIMEEMMRQKIIKTYLGALSGRTSVLKDFYSDRM